MSATPTMTELGPEKDPMNEVERASTSSNSAAEWTADEERKLVRKIDLFLLPTIWLMCLLSYIDRTNIGNAKIAGMAEDLYLSSSQYSVALVVFFVGYVVFEPPSNMILVRNRPSRYLPAIMAIWGVLTCLMSLIKSYHHLIVLRILWRDEQSKRFAVSISAAILSGAFGGFLAGAITGGLEEAHGLRGWRWLFIVEGVATIGWAMITTFILLDFPATSSRLTERERYIATNRLRELGVTVRTAGSPKIGKKQSFVIAVTDRRTWGFILGYMVIVGSSTLSYFYPTLVHGLGFKTTVTAQYMTVPIYAFAFVCTDIAGFYCDRVPTWRGVIIAGCLGLSMITSILICVVYNFAARYVLLVVMAAGLWASNALSLSIASSTFGSMEPEVRAIALAVVNAMGNLAQIYGAYLFPSDNAPKYLIGFGVILGLLGFGVAAYITMHLLLRKAWA